LVEVSAMIPTRNEAETIGVSISKIGSVFEEHGMDGEIIVSE